MPRFEQKVYSGRRNRYGVGTVRVINVQGDSDLLSTPGLVGFDWGEPLLLKGTTQEEGHASLAFALLADAAEPKIAAALQHDFQTRVICRLPRQHWHLTQSEVLQLAQQIANAR